MLRWKDCDDLVIQVTDDNNIIVNEIKIDMVLNQKKLTNQLYFKEVIIDQLNKYYKENIDKEIIEHFLYSNGYCIFKNT